MKIISLNTWAGHEYDALMEFIENSAHDTDIFCLQEICRSDGPKISRGTRTNIMEDIRAALPNFTGTFAEADSGFDEKGSVDFDIVWGQATFVRNNIAILDSGLIAIHDGDKEHCDEYDYRCVLQYTKLKTEGVVLFVCNVHGTPRPGDKLDTPQRLTQSRRIKKFLSDIDDPVILCGDFNLMPNTESIRTLEENLENLITTHAIETTRSELSPYFGTAQQQNFADYMFVSSDIVVEEFSVPNVKISDHLPMILNFSAKTE